MRAVAVLVVTVATLVAASSASAAAITENAKTARYSLTLTVGPSETMYTQAEVKATHPVTGEVMIGGSMSMAGSMTAMKSEVERHLELHVAARSSGAVVTDVMPKITLTDHSSMAMAMAATKVDAVAMQSVTKGASDRHYGNNVSLTLGDVYKVAVVVNGEKASFTFKAA